MFIHKEAKAVTAANAPPRVKYTAGISDNRKNND